MKIRELILLFVIVVFIFMTVRQMEINRAEERLNTFYDYSTVEKP